MDINEHENTNVFDRCIIYVLINDWRFQMLYEEERKMKIVEYILEHSRASVQELSMEFQVSEATIRRDLKELEEAKLLKRTHGGAVCSNWVNFEPTFGEKEDKLRKEKESIAQKAAELIQDGDTILMDAGTTKR